MSIEYLLTTEKRQYDQITRPETINHTFAVSKEDMKLIEHELTKIGCEELQELQDFSQELLEVIIQLLKIHHYKHQYKTSTFMRTVWALIQFSVNMRLDIVDIPMDYIFLQIWQPLPVSDRKSAKLAKETERLEIAAIQESLMKDLKYDINIVTIYDFIKPLLSDICSFLNAEYCRHIVLAIHKISLDLLVSCNTLPIPYPSRFAVLSILIYIYLKGRNNVFPNPFNYYISRFSNILDLPDDYTMWKFKKMLAIYSIVKS